jgi:hypothetical protein
MTGCVSKKWPRAAADRAPDTEKASLGKNILLERAHASGRSGTHHQ